MSESSKSFGNADTLSCLKIFSKNSLAIIDSVRGIYYQLDSLNYLFKFLLTVIYFTGSQSQPT